VGRILSGTEVLFAQYIRALAPFFLFKMAAIPWSAQIYLHSTDHFCTIFWAIFAPIICTMIIRQTNLKEHPQ